MEITRDSSYNNKIAAAGTCATKSVPPPLAPQKAEQRNVVPSGGCSSFGTNVRGRFFYLNRLPVWVVARSVIKRTAVVLYFTPTILLVRVPLLFTKELLQLRV